MSIDSASKESPDPSKSHSFPQFSDMEFSETSFYYPSSSDFSFPEFDLSGVVSSTPLMEFKRVRIDTLNCPVIAIDTEYIDMGDGMHNGILCYTYAIGLRDDYCTGIINTQTTAESGRIKLAKLLAIAISDALENEILEECPEQMLFCAHFLRVDLFTLSDAFTDIKIKVGGVQKTVASIKGTYGVDMEELLSKTVRSDTFAYTDKNQHRKKIEITFVDSMLFAPAGKGLASVGELVGLPKIEIPPPYSIERMDEFQREQPELFREYAIVDAEISYLHVQKMIDFVADELELRKLPFTIGGIATKAFLNDLTGDYYEVFGYRQEVKEIWPKEGGKPRTVKVKVAVPARRILEGFATECYMGGRNECFMTGPTDVDQWNDFDAPSCYTVILALLKPLNYEAFRMTSDLKDFTCDTCGLARVRFKFPDETKFPSLPVKTGQYGLYYPLSGESHCTAPEIQVAVNMGCEVEILQGFVIPWVKGGDLIFLPFMQLVREKRLSHEKGGFEERLWKEIGNSLYGKLGQGLSGKTAFEVASGLNKSIPDSPITNPYFAAMVTGFARALMSEMLNGIPEDKQVVSVTTDGFLTNASLEDIDLTGPVCNRFRELYHQVDSGGGEILELKHRAKQLIAIKTRGQITAVLDPEHEAVIAKAGIQVPGEVEDENVYMMELYLDRKAGQKVSSKHLTPSRIQFMNDQDVVGVTTETFLNFEPDFKRKLTNPRMVKVGKREHVAYDSQPWPNRAAGEFVRVRMDHWRKSNCLKTLKDGKAFDDFIQMSRLTKIEGVRIQKDERSDQLLARLFLRVYAQGALEVNGGMTYKALAQWLTDSGYTTSASTARSAKSTKLVLGAIPVTGVIVDLLRLLIDKFPSFDYKAMFDQSELDLLDELLQAGYL